MTSRANHGREMTNLRRLAALRHMTPAGHDDQRACRACDGFGRLPSRPAYYCSYCGGKGTVPTGAKP